MSNRINQMSSRFLFVSYEFQDPETLEPSTRWVTFDLVEGEDYDE